MDRSTDQARDDYTGDNVTVLQGIEAIRRRPGMYIGGANPAGIHYLVRELVDLGIKDSQAGVCRNVEVTALRDGSIAVADDGPGLAARFGIELNQVEKLLSGYVWFSSSDWWADAMSEHRMSLSVAKALSEWMELEIRQDGLAWRQSFARGRATSAMSRVDATRRTGTRITFKPDPEIFDTAALDPDVLAASLKERAFLNPELSLTLRIEPSGRSETWHKRGGLSDLVRELSHTSNALRDPIAFKGRLPGGEATGAIQFHAPGTGQIVSYVNGRRIRDDGSPLTAVRRAVNHALADQTPDRSLSRAQRAQLWTDLSSRVTAAVSVSMTSPNFTGQCLDRLRNSSVEHGIYCFAYPRLMQALEEQPDSVRSLLLANA